MADTIDETTMVDLNGPEFVEVVITKAKDGHKIWVNVDGICRFRAYKAKKVITEVMP